MLLNTKLYTSFILLEKKEITSCELYAEQPREVAEDPDIRLALFLTGKGLEKTRIIDIKHVPQTGA